MALPHATEARPYYQSAKQRLEDGQFLFDGKRNTGAVYLAGYAIECMLKALILSALASKARQRMLGSFRGQRAHDFDWLRKKYRQCDGAKTPREVDRDFVRVGSWSVALRYMPGNIKAHVAKEFLFAAARLLTWAEGRLG